MVSVGKVAGGIALEVTIGVPPERVFRALTTVEEIPNFLPEFKRMRFEARLGGDYEFQATGEDGSTFTVRGRISEFDPPRRLAYTWQWQEWEFPETTVSFTLEPVEGGTKVSFLHSGFPAELEESRAEHESHWRPDLQRLKQYAEAKP
jgi:uncharacterized protein YndB with AHSA1/START domain